MLYLNVILFLFSCTILWLASGLVITAIERFSKSTRLSAFAVSALILGILTSLTEISVGINALLERSPTVFAGNLIGGSFVILLCIIPLLAIFNKGIVLRQHLDQTHLLFFIVLLLAPSLLILDGHASRWDAALLVALYGLFLYILQKKNSLPTDIRIRRMDKGVIAKNLIKISIGAVLIFFAGKMLVESTVFIADYLEISRLLVSLLILSIGTNIPELVIAVKTTMQKHSEIAFGNYVGSAVTNPLLFGIFTIIHGPFTIQNSFSSSFIFILIGYVLFFLLARTKSTISFFEGIFLFLFYLLFVLFQASNIFVV